MVIRFAKENELIRVNELRKQVNDLLKENPRFSRPVLIRNYKIMYIPSGKIPSRKLLWRNRKE